ncbi:hypothetical protein NDU88_003251 [Pleurodeles waltl]|uniref:Uncharacterized protein n=1 Tax=Pleurodeles waltl TaxID=8319 RepID=A0AAV7T4K7_PLEWA|nr:hypothetical protein NDU88_003251 [Pleurodeles waltl]
MCHHKDAVVHISSPLFCIIFRSGQVIFMCQHISPFAPPVAANQALMALRQTYYNLCAIWEVIEGKKAILPSESNTTVLSAEEQCWKEEIRLSVLGMLFVLLLSDSPTFARVLVLCSFTLGAADFVLPHVGVGSVAWRDIQMFLVFRVQECLV